MSRGEQQRARERRPAEPDEACPAPGTTKGADGRGRRRLPQRIRLLDTSGKAPAARARGSPLRCRRRGGPRAPPRSQTQITGPPAAANYVLSPALPAPPQVCLLRPAASWGCSRVKPSVAGAQDPARNSGRAAVRHVASAPGCAADCDVCWQRGLEGALLRQSWGV